MNEEIINSNEEEKELKIYYLKNNFLPQMLSGGFLLFLSLIALSIHIIAGILFLIIGMFVLFASVSYYNNNSPQIILNKKGIQMADSILMEWKDVSAVSIQESYDRQRSVYLVYFYKNEKVQIKISNLEYSPEFIKSKVDWFRNENF
ncbi:hypothetical protein [Aureivirga sp. CE67]|uniref:hypothetical protein n=1 Tax=Aureivirga sp. CE67 TaxID=1788983 RepID=UPI0018C9D3E5|nr:hypothetical protein [Aureivirga sp. CE67]